jgi:predicted GNAT family acetyltransferase
VSPLFRKSPEKQAQQAAAKVEIDRLRALSTIDLAVDLLPGLGPEGPRGGNIVPAHDLATKYLLREYPGAGKLQRLDLVGPTNRALNKLQEEGLVRSISYQRTPMWRITPEGNAALADGTVRERLGWSPAAGRDGRDTTALLGPMRENMRAFYRLLGGNSPGGSLVAQSGLLAAIVPACPHQSVVNAVVYEDAEALRAAHAEVADAYARAGVGVWRVWVPDEDRATAAWLEQAGHHMAGSARAMMMDLASLSGEPSGVTSERGKDAAALASLNEQAYGLPAGEFAAVMPALKARSNFYVAREAGEPAACAVALDEGGDCGIYCVATRPASRKRGLAAGLVRQALLEARSRGCTSSSLQSSAVGFSVYQRLGYRDCGALEIWEYRNT